MRWQTGRAEVERLIGDGELERVVASRDQADLLVRSARAHLTSAERIESTDPEGAYALLYDAARKALVALLENQGLRPTQRGGHVAVQSAAMAQMPPPVDRVVRAFGAMRRVRNASEYPSPDRPAAVPEDVRRDLPRATAIVDAVDKVLDQMDVF